MTIFKQVVVVIPLFGTQQEIILSRHHHHMVLHVFLILQRIGSTVRTLVSLHLLRHLGPRMQFEEFTQGESRFDDLTHRIHQRCIHLVLVLQRHRQVIIVVTDIDRIGHNGVFTSVDTNSHRIWRSHTRALGRRIVLITIVLGFIMEDGPATHRHQYFYGVLSVLFL